MKSTPHQFHLIWQWCCCSMRCWHTHRVGRGECYAPTNGCARFRRWLHVNYECFKMRHKQSKRDCANVLPWYQHLIPVISHGLSGTPPAARHSRVSITCPRGLGSVSVYINLIINSCLCHTSLQYPVNEHQLTTATLHTNKKQIMINQQMCFLKPKNLKKTSVIELIMFTKRDLWMNLTRN